MLLILKRMHRISEKEALVVDQRNENCQSADQRLLQKFNIFPLHRHQTGGLTRSGVLRD